MDVWTLAVQLAIRLAKRVPPHELQSTVFRDRKQNKDSLEIQNTKIETANKHNKDLNSVGGVLFNEIER